MPPNVAAVSSSTPAGSGRTARVVSIDVVRGLVMVVMALDHVREFWSPTPVRPEDVAQASVLLFFTRWVTHFCAPTFVLLAGASIWLYQQKQASRRAVSWFLLTRGIWLLTLEVLLINLLLQWSYHLILLQVIWVTGWGMVLLAGLLWLPRWLVGTVAFILLAGHNLLPPIPVATATDAALALLHNGPTVIPLPGLPPLLSAYTLVPWVAVLAAGYWIGPWFQAAPEQRIRWLRLTGGALLALFVGLRFANLYGDPQPWSTQPRGAVYTMLSFVNVTKYPPSLLFVCLTLGVALLVLASTEKAAGRFSQWLRTFGQVPFFYYLLHLALISGSAWLWTRLAFGEPFNFGFAEIKDWPPAYQPSLGRAYAVWGLVVLALYWPCRWYGQFKRRHGYWWLSYL